MVTKKINNHPGLRNREYVSDKTSILRGPVFWTPVRFAGKNDTTIHNIHIPYYRVQLRSTQQHKVAKLSCKT